MASGNVITITGGVNMQEVVAVTDLVDADDYNNPRTNINTLLTTPADVTLGTFTESNTFGYNQSGSGEGAASVGGTILASGANGAFLDLQVEVQELQTFTNQTGVSVSDVGVGDTIAATDWNNLMLAVEDIWNARFSGPVPSAAVTDGSATYVDPWTNNISNEISYTFGSETDCRAFFNGGGRLGVSFSRSGGTANGQNTAWTTTLSSVGDVVINYLQTLADSGTINNPGNFGFYNLTTSYTTILSKTTAAAAYSSDTLTVEAKVDSTTNPTVITFRSVMTDAGDGAIDTSPDGTFTFNARRLQPDVSGTTFTFATPTDNVGAVTGS